jgi:hypothetical protein
MSDKGREALIKINGLAKQWARGIDYVESILRSHGWLHEDDVVEGVEICTVDFCAYLPENRICTASSCTDATIFKYKRPATVKDLIGRKP